MWNEEKQKKASWHGQVCGPGVWVDEESRLNRCYRGSVRTISIYWESLVTISCRKFRGLELCFRDEGEWEPGPSPWELIGSTHCVRGDFKDSQRMLSLVGNWTRDAPRELQHRPSLWCLLLFLIHPAYRCLHSFIFRVIPLKAAFHDISVTNSYSDELDSISYLQLLTRFCTGIFARNLHTVSERMMSCSDKTLTLKWQAVLAKVTQIVFKRIPNDNAMNSASFLECNLAIQNNHCTCV